MSDYIEREAATELIENKQKELCPVGMYSRHALYGFDREKFDAWQEIIDAIDAIPAVDVAPVRHGRWTPADQTGDCCYTCSECGFERDAYLLDVGNYCPNCGCCMLGGGEDDTVSDKQ